MPDDKRTYSREFGAYFVVVLALSCGLFNLLETTGLVFLRDFLGGWLEQVAMSLLPSLVAILAVALGGMRYAAMSERDQQEARQEAAQDPSLPNRPLTGLVTRLAVGDACYYMGFLLTLWGLFLELLNLGSSLRDGGLSLVGDGLIGDLIAGNGLALLSTIIGLVTRFIIHRFFPAAAGEADTADRLLGAFEGYARATGSFQGQVLSHWQRQGRPAKPAAAVAPAGPQIVIRTHAISADLDARHGEVHIGDMREADGLRRRVDALQQEVDRLRQLRQLRQPRQQRPGRCWRWRRG